jgi:hypothetical protein
MDGDQYTFAWTRLTQGKYLAKYYIDRDQKEKRELMIFLWLILLQMLI